MIYITSITDSSSQSFNIDYEEETIFFHLRYAPAVQMWFLDMRYLDIEIYTMRVVCGSNMLEQYSNIIPFGLTCIADVDDAYIPNKYDDFLTGRVVLTLLETEEVAAITDAYSIIKGVS